MFVIYISKKAKRELKNVPGFMESKIMKHLQTLESFPEIDCKKIKFEQDCFRTRVGEYRVIFSVDFSEKVIKITHIRRRTSKTYRNI